MERGPSAERRATMTIDHNFTKDLIGKVRANPCLYEISKGTQNVFERKAAWNRIKMELDFEEDAQQLSVIWKNLRDKYVKKRYKAQKYPSVRQTWVYFERMTWLDMYLE
ncbi:unnamed protein product [Caenorhabditis sp. 36 PRJEB53466]|nr:unnamed protein product [Caenorhabditis sp. 36 PRJEB53466]